MLLTVRQLAAKLCGVIPFGAVLVCQPLWASLLATQLSDAAVSAIAPAVVALATLDRDPFEAEVPPSDALVVADADSEGTSGWDSQAGLSTPDGKHPRGGRQSPGRAPPNRALPSLRVPKSTVLKFAQSGVRPTGKPVSALGPRPAGIQVFGATALGIGVRDGDVLTHVNGVPVTSVSQVVALVISARGAHLPQISGQLWRGQRRYTLVVEQPYLQPTSDGPKSSSGPQDSGNAVSESVGGSTQVARPTY